MLSGEASRDHEYISLIVESHLAPLPGSGSQRNPLTFSGFGTSDLLLLDQVSIDCGAATCATPEPSPLYKIDEAGEVAASVLLDAAQTRADQATLCLSTLIGSPP